MVECMSYINPNYQLRYYEFSCTYDNWNGISSVYYNLLNVNKTLNSNGKGSLISW